MQASGPDACVSGPVWARKNAEVNNSTQACVPGVCVLRVCGHEELVS